MKKIFANKYTWAVLGAIVAVIIYRNWSKKNEIAGTQPEDITAAKLETVPTEVAAEAA